MVYLKTSLITILCSLVLYISLNLLVLYKPLTIGYIEDSYAHKIAYGQTLTKPKVVIISGSNGLFGFSCEVFSKETSTPCLNFASAAALGIDVIIAKAKNTLTKGDIVILPLEYNFYASDKKNMQNNQFANQYMITYDREILAKFPISRQITALFSLSFKDVFSSIIEIALDKAGYKRRFNMDMLTLQGDMKGHTKANAVEYTDYINLLKPAKVGIKLDLNNPTAGMIEIINFIDWAKKQGITIVGTFPTSFDDEMLTENNASVIKKLYTSNGAEFIATDKQNRYPRGDFYDTVYHLNEEMQGVHTGVLARLFMER